MAYEKSKSTQDNFDKFIYQFQPKTETLVRKLQRKNNIDKMCLYYLIKHT